jgi:predicted transposase/invertase (TIGR01784 family)
MNMKFLDVKNDVAFRKIFGNENKKEVLISFLNAVIILPNHATVVDLEVLSTQQMPDFNTGKVTIVDVKASDAMGNVYIVEMQVADADGFHKRVLYYASKSYTSQLKRGDDYRGLKPTYFIGILDFVATENPDYVSRHIVKDAKTGQHFIKDIEFNFIELPKFNKDKNELSSIIDQWIFFIKNAENLSIMPENTEDEGLKTAYQEASEFNWTSDELEAYEKVCMRENDEKNRIEKAVEDGKIEVAIKLKNHGIAIEIIAKSTGLSIAQIEAL